MSTIDMTQVAGIQAVNAEGNVIGTLSVDDLTELVATKIVQEAKNEAVSARSASVMSEASTLAATDEYEDQLALDTNPAYIRSLDTNGNPKRTAIASLASVVGGLLPEATSTRNGLMSAYYSKYYPKALWETNYNTKLVKIATMKKQAGAITPLIMFFAETYATGVSSMFILSIINRTEGIFSNIKTLGPGSKKGFSFFYKEEDDGSLSIYIRLTNFSEVICIWAYTDGIDKYNFTSIPQSSTDTSELTEIQIS